MTERSPTHHISDADLLALPVDPPQIDTPVIDIQDLEHKPGPGTRVSNKGVKVEPATDEVREADEREFAKEDAEAIDAIEEFEKSLARQPPG